MYYLYHIPGKKIGVTRNLNTRVTLIQGYKEGEYEVLEQSEDIDYISDREIELQKSYGYRVDIHKYNKLMNKNNKMKINFTEQTTTFPCPLNKLKGNLMDNIGLSWTTEHGTFEITEENIPWIVKNSKTSMFNKEKCYVYNKSFSEAFHDIAPEFVGDARSNPSIFDLIRTWGSERGIHKRGSSQVQFIKLMEESGELAEALLKNDDDEIVDAIGDIVVVLTNLAHIEGVKIEDCIESAYNVIKHRKGKMTRGTFVKETL
tara:strand:- start:1237 stop:2016 length:780 start_codon:yes stop_codon:yes gene_type:complete